MQKIAVFTAPVALRGNFFPPVRAKDRPVSQISERYALLLYLNFQRCGVEPVTIGCFTYANKK
jgi:hypothetical protein